MIWLIAVLGEATHFWRLVFESQWLSAVEVVGKALDCGQIALFVDGLEVLGGLGLVPNTSGAADAADFDGVKTITRSSSQ